MGQSICDKFGMKGVPPRLCGIYLRDVVSLLDHGGVYNCQQMSRSCNDIIATIDANYLPRQMFENLSLSLGNVRPFLLLSLNTFFTL